MFEWVTHNEKRVLVGRFTGLTDAASLELIDEIERELLKHRQEPASVLFLTCGATSMNDIASRCIDIIAKSKNISPETITLATTFDELNADSLDKINISFEVEESFNIDIPDEALGSIKTVGDMVDGVTKLVSAKPPAATAS